MCARCADAVRRLYPDVPDNEAASFLMASTCFPFGSHRDAIRQLFDHRRAGARTAEAAMRRAEAQLEEAMAARKAGG